jgi:hypothetical protein
MRFLIILFINKALSSFSVRPRPSLFKFGVKSLVDENNAREH